MAISPDPYFGINRGDVVTLRSGGQRMTVSGRHDHGRLGVAWMTPEGPKFALHCAGLFVRVEDHPPPVTWIAGGVITGLTLERVAPAKPEPKYFLHSPADGGDGWELGEYGNPPRLVAWMRKREDAEKIVELLNASAS